MMWYSFTDKRPEPRRWLVVSFEKDRETRYVVARSFEKKTEAKTDEMDL